jgi:hypothetical protein
MSDFCSVQKKTITQKETEKRIRFPDNGIYPLLISESAMDNGPFSSMIYLLF